MTLAARSLVGIVGQIFADGIVQRELARLDELQRRDRGEHLVHRSDAELRVECYGSAGLPVGAAPGPLQQNLAVPRDEQGAGELIVFREIVGTGGERRQGARFRQPRSLHSHRAGTEGLEEVHAGDLPLSVPPEMDAAGRLFGMIEKIIPGGGQDLVLVAVGAAGEEFVALPEDRARGRLVEAVDAHILIERGRVELHGLSLLDRLAQRLHGDAESKRFRPRLMPKNIREDDHHQALIRAAQKLRVESRKAAAVLDDP